MSARIPVLKHGPGNALPLTAVVHWAQVLTCVIAVAITFPSTLSAQYGYFGQNKIQYRRFDWRVLRGEHVDLYYYPEEEELGRVALAYAEESYDVLERRVPHPVRRPLPRVVHASQTHVQHSNTLPFLSTAWLLRAS